MNGNNNNIESLLSSLIDAQRDMANAQRDMASAIIDRFDRFEGGMIRMYEQMNHAGKNQAGQLHGSAMGHTGAFINKYGVNGGNRSRGYIEGNLKTYGRFVKGLEKLVQTIDQGDQKLEENYRRREEAERRLNEQLEQQSNASSQSELDTLNEQIRRTREELKSLGDEAREVKKKQNEAFNSMYDYAKKNPKAVEQGVKRGRRYEDYEHYQSTHKMTKYKDFDSYNRHMDTMEATQRYRNDLQTAQDMVSKSPFGDTKIGNTINKGFDFINQGLNTWDTISQVRSIFGKGGGGGGGNPFARLIGNGGGASSEAAISETVASSGEAVASAGGEMGAAMGEAGAAMGETATAAEGATAALGSTGTAAATAEGGLAAAGSAAGGASAGLVAASASLGIFAVAVIAAVAALKTIVAMASASFERTEGDLATQNELAARLSEQKIKKQQKDADVEIEQAQADADIKVKESEVEGQASVASAQADSQKQIASAQADAEKAVAQAQADADKRVMDADLNATIIEKQADIASGFLTDGINATAWKALKADVELGAMKATQTAEKKRIDTQLGATKTAADAVRDASIANANTVKSITDTRLSTERELYTDFRTTQQAKKIQDLESQYKREQGVYEADQYVTAAIGNLESDKDWGGNVSQALLPTFSDRTESAEDVAEHGISVGGDRVSFEDYDNMALHDEFTQRTGGNAGHHGFGDAAWDLMGADNSGMRKEQIKGASIDIKYGYESRRIKEATAVQKDLISAQKNYTVAMNKANYAAQVGNINAQKQMQLANIAANKQKQLTDIQAQSTENIEKRWIDASAKVKDAWIEAAQKMEEEVSNLEALTNDYGLSLGYTQENMLRGYEKFLLQDVRDITHKYAVDTKEYLEMRSGYNDATGRSSQLTGSDIGQMSALSKYFGHDAGFVTEYTGAMEVFNQGVSESVDRLDKAMQSVNKIGLNGRKYAKELAQNLKLAQKYNFKDGTQGLMKMTEWAMKTRFNMQSLGGMIDKILDGGLEGVIEQSSRFQVLGGNAAIYSDPFSMMYNAGADPAALGEQFQNMTKGLGSIDRNTGETTFNWNENMLLREIAKGQNRDVSEVMDEVRARNRRDSVKLAMSAQQKSLFNEDQLDYMGNLAHYSKEKGGFAINVYNGDGTFTEKGIDEIRPEDLEQLQPKEHNERMEDYMQRLLSAVEQIKGEEIREGADFAVETFNAMLENFKQRAENAYNEYSKHREEMIETITGNWALATEKTKDFLTSAQNNANNLDQVTGEAAQAISNFTDALRNATNLINGGGSGSVNDAYIAGNGHSMFGTASKVTPINDGYVTNPADEGLIGKSGGWVDKLINGIYTMVSEMYNGGGRGNMSLNVNGSLRLESNGQSIDLISELRNNPLLVREITAMIFRQGSMNMNGGKGKHPWNDDSGNTYYA